MRFSLGQRSTASVIALALLAALLRWPGTPLHAATTPVLVQHVSTSTNQSERGNKFVIKLPNAALAGNCLILTLTYAQSAARTVTITDNIGTNTWINGPTTSSGALTTSLYYVLGVEAGTQTITVTFDAALRNFQAVVSEFYNVATANAIDGSVGTSVAIAPGVAAGSLTPSSDGDLVYQYAIDLAKGTLGGSDPNTGITAGTSFTLLSACRELGAVAQYRVQASHAAINPKLTVSGNTDHFNTVAIALKSAAAGSAPPPGIRIVHKYDLLPTLPATLQFPSSGNLLVVGFTVTTDQVHVSSVTDSLGNAYTNPLSVGNPQMFYAASANSDPTLTITIVASGSSGPRQDVTMYDVVGAAPAPYDKSVSAWGGMAATNADILHAPDIVPSTANGLVFALLNMGIGPPSASIGAGYVFDSVFYTGQTDASVMTYGEGRAHIYNSTTAPLSFGYHVKNDGTLSGWFGSAVAFKAAPRPSPPTNLRVVVP